MSPHVLATETQTKIMLTFWIMDSELIIHFILRTLINRRTKICHSEITLKI